MRKLIISVLRDKFHLYHIILAQLLGMLDFNPHAVSSCNPFLQLLPYLVFYKHTELCVMVTHPDGDICYNLI